MRAAILRKGELVVDTIADPVPAAGQVLVKTLCCGICGSDLHVAKHTRQFVDVANRAGRRWVTGWAPGAVSVIWRWRRGRTARSPVAARCVHAARHRADRDIKRHLDWSRCNPSCFAPS